MNDLDVPQLVRARARPPRARAGRWRARRSTSRRATSSASPTLPLADPYDPARLEAKLDAGADLVWTQITYDVDALAAWADVMRARGVLERAKVLVGVVPLRSAKGGRFMDEKLPGVARPAHRSSRGWRRRARTTRPRWERVSRSRSSKASRQIPGIGGVHLMGMGHDDAVRAVVEGAGLFPRPTGVR